LINVLNAVGRNLVIITASEVANFFISAGDKSKRDLNIATTIIARKIMIPYERYDDFEDK
jgi:hypothetical protein